MPLDVSFACPDWEAKLRRGETPIPDLPLDRVRADAAVDLLNLLRVPNIKGQPTFGEAGGEWVRDIVRSAFGARDPVTGTRYLREIFNLVPKKNGKTTNSAAIGLVWLMMNEVPNVEGVIIGPTIEVAQTCFEQVAAMIAADPYLTKRFHVIDHKRTIVDLHRDPETQVRRNAKLKIKSFDPKVVTGSIPAFAILDELHVMAEDHAAIRVIGQIRGGMITNDDSLMIIITTQSEKPPHGVFKAELDYARAVRDGEITRDVTMLPVIYEFPMKVQASRDQAWRDQRLWGMVLPNLGRGFTLDRLAAEYRQAIDKGREEEIRWASQHLNIQIGLGLGTDRWPGADHWEACAQTDLTLEKILDQSDVCTIGGDWGGADDLAALVVLGRHRQTKVWMAWCQAWARPVVLERRKSIAAELQDFEKAGGLRIVKSPEQQAAEAADICKRIDQRGLLPEKDGIGLDSAAVALLADALAERGLEYPLVCAVPQNWQLQPATQTLPLKLESRRLVHCGQPILGWAVGNAKQELRGNTYAVQKAAAGASKIDPLAALFNAAILMFKNPAASNRGVRDFLANPIMAFA